MQITSAYIIRRKEMKENRGNNEYADIVPVEMRSVGFHDRTSDLYHSVLFSMILKLVHAWS
jgi:hypothetical protein